MPDFTVLDLGIIDYQECVLLQKDLSGRVFRGESQSALILCQHHPVITLGRLAKRENILLPQKTASLGIGIIETDRGGDVTLHLPGQLVVYPVFDLRLWGRDIGFFLRGLEQAVLLLLADYGVSARRRPGLTGVWEALGEKKIASIGIAVRRWVTTHGLSLNVNCGLDLFSLIRPCGRDIMMTSIQEQSPLKSGPSMDEVKEKAVEKFRLVFCSAIVEGKYD